MTNDPGDPRLTEKEVAALFTKHEEWEDYNEFRTSFELRCAEDGEAWPCLTARLAQALQAAWRERDALAEEKAEVLRHTPRARGESGPDAEHDMETMAVAYLEIDKRKLESRLREFESQQEELTRAANTIAKRDEEWQQRLRAAEAERDSLRLQVAGVALRAQVERLRGEVREVCRLMRTMGPEAPALDRLEKVLAATKEPPIHGSK